MKHLVLATAMASTVIGLGLSVGTARAKDPVACRTIRTANIGWTDNKVQNAVFSNLLRPLGYHVRSNLYSLQVMYAGMVDNKIDVFLDNWTPSQDPTTKPYESKHEIDVIGPDLEHAKYTLVVPHYLYEKGLKSFADIHKFAGALHHKIYGIEPGNDGNQHIEAMIKANKDHLGSFHLVQSSEAGMLAEVSRKYAHKQPIVFLGWEPHPMNVEFHINYLPGGASYFGPHEGEATIYINTRHDYARQCPNVGRLLHQFRLTVTDENRMMYKVQVKHQAASSVAAAWLKAHPAWVRKTLAGVTTFDGKPAAPVVEKHLQG